MQRNRSDRLPKLNILVRVPTTILSVKPTPQHFCSPQSRNGDKQPTSHDLFESSTIFLFFLSNFFTPFSPLSLSTAPMVTSLYNRGGFLRGGGAAVPRSSCADFSTTAEGSGNQKMLQQKPHQTPPNRPKIRSCQTSTTAGVVCQFSASTFTPSPDHWHRIGHPLASVTCAPVPVTSVAQYWTQATITVSTGHISCQSVFFPHNPPLNLEVCASTFSYLQNYPTPNHSTGLRGANVPLICSGKISFGHSILKESTTSEPSCR